ncbi:ribonuclease III [Candidatus Dojkabacteria bacterium]|uniref:Ribonuclease 3 n=1 Tax=Candidatus Dojkabacteria bacterium TaxID=2099670 RepID=A0A847VED5_9BACT|nr:ribonuclease III [Candidatus Dojkabacteria bacterium]
MNKINELQEIIGISFNNPLLLKTALTHCSYINEHKSTNEHNERLEFLGDAVLELIVSDYLFREYPKRPEGELTSFRAALVRTESLAHTAKELNIGKYLLLSKGEERTGGREKEYLLANAYEAIIGAIYLDQGYSESKHFVLNSLTGKLSNIIKKRLDIDSKTKIQEISQEKYKITPVYEVISEVGPDHEKTFTVVVKIDEKIIGEGIGPSKQKAEEMAAAEGLQYLEKK